MGVSTGTNPLKGHHLDALGPFEELNILILGERGVGKSTWINAFINYLTFGTLDEALATESLKWVIPCSFRTQVPEQGKLIQRSVSIGSSKNENDGSTGESATQLTSIYAVNIGRLRVRLIDTAGIGDACGVDQDDENMADIMRVLRSYKNIHGILILLNSDASGLRFTIRDSIKQLLIHLHKNAAENIVFGFTHARRSDYRPGNAFMPLQKVLTEYSEINMGLFENNVYYFDSESFRYLAARNNGIDMGCLKESRRSWEHSARECKRLVRHFEGMKPHEVRSMINLRKARKIMVQLIKFLRTFRPPQESEINRNKEGLSGILSGFLKALSYIITSLALFLSSHAITPHNSTMFGYIDMLIHQKMLTKSDGDEIQEIYDSVLKEQAKQAERANETKETMDSDSFLQLDDGNIEEALDDLLVPRGSDEEGLSTIFSNDEKAAESTYREISSNIFAGSHWNRQRRKIC